VYTIFVSQQASSFKQIWSSLRRESWRARRIPLSATRFNTAFLAIATTYSSFGWASKNWSRVGCATGSRSRFQGYLPLSPTLESVFPPGTRPETFFAVPIRRDGATLTFFVSRLSSSDLEEFASTLLRRKDLLTGALRQIANAN
jgi:hypothetical protein